MDCLLGPFAFALIPNLLVPLLLLLLLLLLLVLLLCMCGATCRNGRHTLAVRVMSIGFRMYV